MSKVFIDTNILLYAYDEADRRKQKAARATLAKSHSEGNGVISTQVLQEFYVAGTGKLKMEPLIAKSLLDTFDVFETVVISPALIAAAADYHLLFKLSFWDALIIAAAEAAKCETIWTEDLNPGQKIRGIKVENPLSA
jgi:predicted nucleic acid-binding protein